MFTLNCMQMFDAKKSAIKNKNNHLIRTVIRPFNKTHMQTHMRFPTC